MHVFAYLSSKVQDIASTQFVKIILFDRAGPINTALKYSYFTYL